MSFSLVATYRPGRGGRYVQGAAGAGTTLRHALREARRLADQLECGIEFAFNGRLAWIDPGGDPEAQCAFLEHVWQHAQSAEEGR